MATAARSSRSVLVFNLASVVAGCVIVQRLDIWSLAALVHSAAAGRFVFVFSVAERAEYLNKSVFDGRELEPERERVPVIRSVRVRFDSSEVCPAFWEPTP